MAKNYEVEIRYVNYFKQDAHTTQLFGETHQFPQRQGMIIGWDATVGWGELTIIQYNDGSMEVDSEGMGQEFVRQVLDAYTRYIMCSGGWQ